MPATTSVLTAYSRPSAPEAWARCGGRATASWSATSRSKLLPDALAEDPERLARFRREAQLLASLNHPNIGTIHGLEESNGKPFLTLELVEGEDLAKRLARGAIPCDEALEIAKQVAEALEEAHGKGVVHRDLKPANVKITTEGRVKVLDFGLAKALGAETAAASSSAIDVSQSPTLARSGTLAGRSWEPRPTWLRSRRAASRWTAVPTSGASASCSSRC